MKSWTVPVEEENGELILTIPDELIEEMKWKENDILNWIDNGDGSWTLEKRMKIQTCGSYHPDDGYTLTIAFNHYHTITLDGLTSDDLQEIKSCVDCMLVEESELDLPTEVL